MKSVIVVIPAYNEEKTIKNVLNSLIKYDIDIVVVDDGSTDKTSLIANKMGVATLINNKNIGYDKTLERGLFYGIQKGYKYAITMDADGQHPVEDINYFIKSFNEGYALVIGIRGKLQRISEYIFASYAKLMWGIVDPLCGMKGYKLSCLEEFRYFDSYKSMGTEFAIRLVKSGIKKKQFRLSRVIDRADESRLGSSIKANMYILKSLIYGIIKT
mgnify:CR=1 FL=1